MVNLLLVTVAFVLYLVPSVSAFVASSAQRNGRGSLLRLRGARDDCEFRPTVDQPVLRRTVLRTSILAGFFGAACPAWAANRQTLDDVLYRIVRVREATQQESRLIKSGKFKDVQRANIKLAVRFMVENYRLNDAFVAASTYLDGTNRRLQASQVGQTAVQNLYTILEYFDSSDVENLKVRRSLSWTQFADKTPQQTANSF